VSRKHSSLAYDELKQESHAQSVEMVFEPQLNLLVNTRFVSSSLTSGLTAFEEEVVKIGGRITVSF